MCRGGSTQRKVRGAVGPLTFYTNLAPFLESGGYLQAAPALGITKLSGLNR